MNGDYLTLATSCLSACCEKPERQRRARKGAVAGPLWSVNVPIPTSIIDRVLMYAADQRVYIDGHWGSLKSVTANENGVTVNAMGVVYERDVELTARIGFANDDERTLCNGRWLVKPHGEVRLAHLVPIITKTSYGAFVAIGAAARRKAGWPASMFAGEYYDADIKGFELTRTGAEIITTSRAKNFILPHINFVQPEPAALQVESKR